MNYLLDTNLVLIYLRDNDQSRRIEDDLNLLSGENNLIVSVVSVGEMRPIAKQNKWGPRKIQRLMDTVADFLIADINTEDVIERYAEIDAFSQGKLVSQSSTFTARNMGKNDLWIAATASVYDTELITTDGDCEHLQHEYLTLRLIELDKYR